ncbi:hypothetical protein C0J52_17594 [Blattella germanica]|nr:hypothetical protein C0J52_17594 [Blattella germanica]PSN32443.1 hypothetical protein C0J52_17594 [Blattella germanica]
MADKLAKEASKDNDQEAIFNRIPLTTVTTEINKTTLHKWQQQWETTVNGALCRQFFPNNRAKTEDEDTSYTNIHSNSHWPWKNKLIPPQF